MKKKKISASVYVDPNEIVELLDAPTEPVELADAEGVALPQNVERLLQSRAVSDSPAHRVVEEPVASERVGASR